MKQTPTDKLALDIRKALGDWNHDCCDLISLIEQLPSIQHVANLEGLLKAINLRFPKDKQPLGAAEADVALCKVFEARDSCNARGKEVSESPVAPIPKKDRCPHCKGSGWLTIPSMTRASSSSTQELCDRLEREIMITPTGSLRNLLCDANVIVRSFFPPVAVQELENVKLKVQMTERDVEFSKLEVQLVERNERIKAMGTSLSRSHAENGHHAQNALDSAEQIEKLKEERETLNISLSIFTGRLDDADAEIKAMGEHISKSGLLLTASQKKVKHLEEQLLEKADKPEQTEWPATPWNEALGADHDGSQRGIIVMLQWIGDLIMTAKEKK